MASTWKWTLGLGLAAAAAVSGTLTSGLSAQAGSAQEVTYTKHIAPILQRSCENCHRAGGGGQMPLTTYEEVRPWARAIKTRTGIGPHAGVMPPWYMEKNIGIQQVQGRSVAERRRSRHGREVGRQRCPARQSG